MHGARVVVTGLGLVTPLGIGVETNWTALREGRSGVGPLSRFDGDGLPWQLAAEVRDFHAEDWVSVQERRRVDLFILYAIAAATEAVKDSGVVDTVAPERIGVVLGVGLGGLPRIEEGVLALRDGGYRKLSPLYIPSVLGNLAAGQVAMRFGATGVNLTLMSACASGAHAVGEAFEMIRSGRVDVVIAGGAEAVISPSALTGFGLMRALSTWGGHPAAASRPFDTQRCGFVLGEGAGILVLESEECARRRGATVHASVLGYGASGDAHHVVQPPDDGSGLQRAIRLALTQAEMPPEAVDHVNPHATATQQGDLAEARAFHAVFGSHVHGLRISATKSMTGHLLGAAGAVEAAYTVLALERGLAPPTINYDEPDLECDLEGIRNEAISAPLHVGLSTSCGFGGTNAALLFGTA